MMRRRAPPAPAQWVRCQGSASTLAQQFRNAPSASDVQRAGRDAGRNTRAAPAGPGMSATRLEEERLNGRDPLGGMYHRDYYRDPVEGFAPVHAPRNFSRGGELHHHHPTSGGSYMEGTFGRNFAEFDSAREASGNASSRRALRNLRPSERDAMLTEMAEQGGDVNRRGMHKNESIAMNDVLNNHYSDPIPQAHLPKPSARHANASLGHSGLEGSRLTDRIADRNEDIYWNQTAEVMRDLHGLRDKERFEHDRSLFTQRPANKGFNMQRQLQMNAGKVMGQTGQISNALPPSQALEAQRNIRENAIPEDVAVAAKVMSRNTTRNEPVLGEDLSEEIVSTIEASRQNTRRAAVARRREQFGLGRQQLLVQESGPDRRVQELHKNDERLLKGLHFKQNVYRDSATDEHADPYIRNSTANGVGHLLNSKFDIDRRNALQGSNKQDITERNTVYYGVPVKQQLDEFVFRKRGARGDRHLDFYMPWATVRDLQLAHPYRDLEGFPLFDRARTETYDWELFVRYRAHMEQRRAIGLKHGLEPKRNETVAERDARRAKLDAICEATPFDHSYVTKKANEESPSLDQLREWFGEFMLPSPSSVELVMKQTIRTNAGLPLEKTKRSNGELDSREHVLSGRYLSVLLTHEGFNSRMGRQPAVEASATIPEPDLEFRLSAEEQKALSPSERQSYDEYVKKATAAHIQTWAPEGRARRWLQEHNSFGTVAEHLQPVEVVSLESCDEAGADLLVSKVAFESLKANPNGTFEFEGAEYRTKGEASRFIVPLRVRLDNGTELTIDATDFGSRPTDTTVEDPNAMQSGAAGEARFHYNRSNYIETQDAIWEERTASAEEGWVQAVHTDGLEAGMVVKARRALGGGIRGEPTRAVIIEYLKQPFFNPDPRTISVRFADDGGVEHVPLADIQIWQRSVTGPERAQPDRSRKTVSTVRRYLNVVDPDGSRAARPRHFLDAYVPAAKPAFDTVKQITDIDRWTKYDHMRAANHRQLTITNRKDYIRGGYFYRYTPWEYILHQEAEQPIIRDQLRSDDVGPSMLFNPNRYWRYKRRPYGYIRNYRHEVRDMFKYMDAVTPWKTAQKIRTHAEVREHHPMPVFNRPQMGLHRNTPSLLPSHLWETDKRTGSVTVLKDSVRDYKTTTPYPAWVNL